MELEFVTTEELIDELLGRFDYAAFAGWSSQSDTIEGGVMRWVGPPHALVGLLQHTSVVLTNRMEDINLELNDSDLLDLDDEEDEEDECF